jgi:hypothetical protein
LQDIGLTRIGQRVCGVPLGKHCFCDANVWSRPCLRWLTLDPTPLKHLPGLSAVILCADKKPSIQALERAQGDLPNGRVLTGESHNYKRNGTTTLFGVVEVATGKVKTAHKKRSHARVFQAVRVDRVKGLPAPHQRAPSQRLVIPCTRLTSLWPCFRKSRRCIVAPFRSSVLSGVIRALEC